MVAPADISSHVACALLAGVGTPGFGAALDAALRSVVPFGLSALLAYPSDARPVLHHDGLGGVSPPEVMEAYLSGTYLLDAVYAACQARRPEGLYRLRDLAPDAFFEAEYYNDAQVHPCISLESGALAEELAFLVALPQGHYASYSAMRSSAEGPFTDEEFARLDRYAPLVRAAILRQLGAGPPRPAPEPPPDLEDAFLGFGAGTLSRREQAIVSLVLRGHSSASISAVLGIAEGTVKNHRKHIHAKLGISSQAELFALFLAHLRGPATRAAQHSRSPP